MSKSKGYTLREKPHTDIREALREYPEFIQDLLAARNIFTAEDAREFFNPDYEQHVHDPFMLRDMDRAVTRVIKAIDSNEYIAIYSDFDADGIPGGALLHDALKKIGYERFTNYIPHRDTEGYGFHKTAIEKLAAHGVTLIVTVDVGISDCESAAYAQELGIDVIITDHHIPGDSLPEAVAVINPKRSDETYPFTHLCGSGVAFKLVQALFSRARDEQKTWIQDVPIGWEKWLLDLVAIATVADMMPLIGENRALVHYGLFVLRKSQRPGIHALCRRMGIQQAYITEDDIGFSIAPRLNAASRMDSPEKGFELLTTKDVATATNVAKELDSLNNKRKGHVASIVRELKKRFAEHSDEKVLVAGNPKWNPALLGLAANSLVDTYGKTVCVWGREGTGNIKGSCRGHGGVNIVEMFERAQDVLSQFGGHAHAGGFSVTSENVHTLAESLNEAYDAVEQMAGTSVISVDAELPTTQLQKIHSTLSPFAPFGIENPKPIFVYKSAHVVAIKQFGNDDAHIEIMFEGASAQNTVRAIAFFKNKSSFSTTPFEKGTVDVICTLEVSRFRGRTQFELRIVDIV